MSVYYLGAHWGCKPMVIDAYVSSMCWYISSPDSKLCAEIFFKISLVKPSLVITYPESYSALWVNAGTFVKGWC